MADGSITLATDLDNKQLEKQLQSLKKKIESIEDGISQKKAEKFSLLQQTEQLTANLDAAKAKLDQMQSGKGFFTSASIQEQTTTVKAMQSDWEKVQKQVEQYDTAIGKATIQLNQQKEKAGAIHQELAKAGPSFEAMHLATEKAQKSAQRFSMRLREVVRSALVFTVITQALSKFRTWMGKVIKTSSEAAAAVAKLKGALLTLAQPLVNVIIPAFTTFVNVLTRIISAIAQAVSMLFGTTVEQSAQAAENLYDEQNAISEVGAAAKKAGKSLAAFDEINQLSGDSAGGGSGIGASDGGISPDFNGFQTGFIKDEIDEITAYVSGALLALGAILAFSGANIPLGIGLMAIGAIVLASEIAANWGAMTDPLREAITNVLLLLGGALLVVGAILVLSGANIPLGLALMAAGALSIASAAAMNWGAMSGPVQQALSLIMVVVFSFIIVIGLILTVSGVNIPVGLSLIAMGALGIAGVAALNWGKITADISQALGVLLAIIGTFMAIIGTVLLLLGVNLPLGIGLLIAGIAIFGVGSVALQWDAMQTGVATALGTILKVAGGCLLALGLILTLTGVAAPLGIALMIAGGAALGVSAVVLNWDFILEKLQGAWGNIKSWWSTNVAKYFTIEYWLNLGKSIVNGFIDGIKSIGSGAMEWGKGIVGDIANAMGINSPSTETQADGQHLVQGLIIGIRNYTPQMEAALLVFATAVLGAFDAMNQTILARQSETQVASQNALSLWMSVINNLFAAFFTGVLTQADLWAVSLQATLDSMVAAALAAAAAISAAMSSGGGSFGGGSSGGRTASSKGAALFNAMAGRSIQIPALAAGAVIPANREFLAVLGDQRGGTNIEAPADLIEQKVISGLQKAGFSGGTGGTINITMEIDRQVFAKMVYKYNKAESRRVGVNLTGV